MSKDAYGLLTVERAAIKEFLESLGIEDAGRAFEIHANTKFLTVKVAESTPDGGKFVAVGPEGLADHMAFREITVRIVTSEDEAASA